MPHVIFCFQFHHPCLLNPERGKFFWRERNQETFLAATETAYLPVAQHLGELVSRYPSFKVAVSLSGIFLELADQFQPAVIEALQNLYAAGEGKGQVELLDETYYHSLTGFFSDPQKQEFRDQVSLHREQLRKTFGCFPKCFRNTDYLFSGLTAAIVADMGYAAILGMTGEEMKDGEGRPVDAETVYRVEGTSLLLIPCQRKLSDLREFEGWLPPKRLFAEVSGRSGDVVFIPHALSPSYAYGGGKFLAFFDELVEICTRQDTMSLAVPADIVRAFGDKECPTVTCSLTSESPCEGAGVKSCAWRGNATQEVLFRDIETLEHDARRSGGELLTQWRHLTASDHLCFLADAESMPCMQQDAHPYDTSATRAAHILTRKIDDLQASILRFEVLKIQERTAVLMITPETGRLPKDMGALAQYISGKSGGQGEVVSALCEGLSERGIDVHLVTLNLKKRFQQESQMDEREWREIRYRIDSEKIHLVSSSVFADNLSAYSGDPLQTAAEFQRVIINNLIKDIRAKHEGRLIVHSHDWMAGGVITAYAKARDLPVLHTVHNVFTAAIPVAYFTGVDINGIDPYLYYTDMGGVPCVDAQATAIKNAQIINFVGEQFLREVVNDYFLDRPIVPASVRMEVKAKYYHGAARAIINAPSRTMYPEACDYCVQKYGPDDDVLAAKRENLVAFQRRTGLTVNPEAILFFWPSRLDPVQKGVELLEAVVPQFIADHEDVQVAIVADGIAGDRTHSDILGGIAWQSGGKMTCLPFSEEVSMLGYAAASDVFGASLYEPCGQIDQIGNLFGATATNRDTGGYHDKIRELRLKVDGATQDVGNGFLFRDYDAGGLRYGLEKSLSFHRRPAQIRERQLRRIMREARERYGLGTMIAEYIRIYEFLNKGRPLS